MAMTYNEAQRLIETIRVEAPLLKIKGVQPVPNKHRSGTHRTAFVICCYDEADGVEFTVPSPDNWHKRKEASEYNQSFATPEERGGIKAYVDPKGTAPEAGGDLPRVLPTGALGGPADESRLEKPKVA